MSVYKFAGFWRRLIAYLIDNTIICLVFFVLFMIAVIGYFLGVSNTEESQWLADLTDPTKISSAMIFIWVFLLALTIGYFTYFHGTTGRTPGKMILGLQVVGEDGKPLTFGIAFLRAVGYFISSIVLNLGFIWVAFDKRKQGWHDKIAGTVVIIREEQTPAEGLAIPDRSPPAQVSQNNN
ncbi:MAG TPA: RDD family protein [Smithellaceae bacterium]|nr:RDD family protein [Smithellaceae bacterium]HRS89509.1 RDD family protein [Smithellaceae bacterium]HRV26459.1 RDD family protein [Smithellaceae bacterium]